MKIINIGCGLSNVRRAYINDNNIPELQWLEETSRWQQCLGFECRKPA